ncbi:hypothetical protein [Streptomyces sp. NBC_01244]|uniref:hypothetical protein n=1 Tax=Streptomyces sp. NBC_01244 TaxID=2903797 RepID=UPI002E14EB4A|nr:hypothetical protein OG247_43590 [Streptomyces sp. NBC_01244]
MRARLSLDWTHSAPHRRAAEQVVAYDQTHGTLAAPWHGTRSESRSGRGSPTCAGLAGWARTRSAPAAIDPDWNPGESGWMVDWQRHYAQLLADGAA